VVITGITLENVFSDVPKRVSVSANLFQSKAQQTGLKNEAGWLFSQQSSELASEASEHVAYSGDGSFVNLCSLLPFEQARHTSCAIYTPTNSSLNQRHLQDYGNISTKEQLWDGIVAVTDSTYYVPSGASCCHSIVFCFFPNAPIHPSPILSPLHIYLTESVVCKVISKNWDRFGFRYVSSPSHRLLFFPNAPIHPSSILSLLPFYITAPSPKKKSKDPSIV
jgi:hypothetical protein